MDENCTGCVHYYAYFRVNRCCNFIFDTGHMRPCPPGAGCVVKQPRQPVGASVVDEKSVKKSAEDHQKQEIVYYNDP